MLSIAKAFSNFKSRLEITQTERVKASKRQHRIRCVVAEKFQVASDFLTGSYKRDTKTKPLKDVDIFVVLKEDDNHDLGSHPGDVLHGVYDVLTDEFSNKRVKIQRRSVRVDYGVEKVDDLTDRVMSFDVVPAFATGGHYVIPDIEESGWMETNPRIHENMAIEANRSCEEHWKPMVKMLKMWNDHADKPITPSFLIEVMSLHLLDSWGGSYPYELKAWFATASDAILRTWEDPAGLGHPVSDRMSDQQLRYAQAKLRAAEISCTAALIAEQKGQIGVALGKWQELFGPTFATSYMTGSCK